MNLRALAKLALVGLATCIFWSGFAMSQTEFSSPTDTQQQVISATVDLCFSPPEDVDGAQEALTTFGWGPPPEPFASEKAIQPQLEALIGISFAAQLNTEALHDSFLNAFFRAASILSNSSLSPNQIGLIYEDAVVAMLGVEEGTPYCAINGPSWLALAVHEAGLDPWMVQSSRLMFQGMGLDDRGGFQISWFLDFDAIIEAVRDPGDGESDLVDEGQVRPVLNPVSIAIYPARTLEELSDK